MTTSTDPKQLQTIESDLGIELLDEAQVATLWRSRPLAANFASYVMYLNARNPGDSFKIKVDANDQEAGQTKKHNFTEAAKKRVTFTEYTDEAGQKQWKETPAPVVLRWKAETHKEQRPVDPSKPKGPTQEVTLVDRLVALVVDPNTVRRRGTRTPTEVVTPATPPANAQAGTTMTLPDGRTAKMGKDGKWRAPKAATPEVTQATTDAAPEVTQNGSTTPEPTPDEAKISPNPATVS